MRIRDINTGRERGTIRQRGRHAMQSVGDVSGDVGVGDADVTLSEWVTWVV